jgi:integrase
MTETEGRQKPRRGRGEGGVYKRKDGLWAAVVNVGWEDGRRRRKTYYGYRTKAEAQTKVRAAVHELDKGKKPVLDERLRYGPYLTDWLENVIRPRRRASTYRGYESKARIHIIPGLGHLRLTAITSVDLDRFFQKKLDEGLSGQTVSHLRAVVRASLSNAVKKKLVADNEAKLTDGVAVDHHEVAALAPDAARAILDAVRGDRLEALYLVALASGCRQGELLGLRWADVSFTEGTIAVTGALQRSAHEFVRVEPKTARSRRTVTLPSFAVDALHAHHARQAGERLKAGAAWQDLGLVFTGPTGGHLHGSNVTLRFQKLLREAGLGHMRFHDLRHGLASLLLAQGVHPRVVMETLGHSNIGTTMDLYSHVIPALQREAADRLGAILTS